MIFPNWASGFGIPVLVPRVSEEGLSQSDFTLVPKKASELVLFVVLLVLPTVSVQRLLPRYRLLITDKKGEQVVVRKLPQLLCRNISKIELWHLTLPSRFVRTKHGWLT